MRAALLQRPGVIEVVEVDDPRCLPDEAVISVARSGVCGTDRSIFRGEYGVAVPVILGHEYAGTVVEVGSAVAGVAVGDRVVVDPNVVDDVCFYCRAGSAHLCQGLSPLGVARSGGFAELSAVPSRYLHHVPATLSLEDAALVEPLACCVRGIDQAHVKSGDLVVVLGAGPIGCFLIQLARLSGATHVVAVEPVERRHGFARRAGADVVCTPSEVSNVIQDLRGPVGADVVIEASGRIESAEAAFASVRRGGTVLLFGVYPQDRMMSVSAFRINEDELRVVGSLNNPSTHARAIELLASRQIVVDGVVSDVLGLSQVEAAMDLGHFDAPGKIAIDPSSR